MKKWLVRIILPLLAGLYPFLVHMLPAALVIRFGALRAASVMFFVVGVWGSLFYLLLYAEGSLAKVRRHIARFLEGQDRGVAGKIKNWFGDDSGEVMPSWGGIVVVFAFLGTFAGVLALRLGSTGGPAARDFLLIWIGCLFSGIAATLVIYGPLMFVLGEAIAFILGGG